MTYPEGCCSPHPQNPTRQVSSCDGAELRALCVFLHRLSRTQKVGPALRGCPAWGWEAQWTPAPCRPCLVQGILDEAGLLVALH